MDAASASSRFTAALAGRYRIEREIGHGGMADVYLAQDVRHERLVAIKVLRSGVALTLGAERFLREIRTAAPLTHSHIVPLYDSGEADGFLYYVMPYIEGESLRQRLDREKQLPVGEAVEIAKQIASALEHAHGRGVIHRDIKPENILLREGAALVTDFGVALAMHARAADRLTETGMSVGTLAYMSPEQATGSNEIDERTDVYSLACVLYEMLCGEPPHSAPTAHALLARIVAQRPVEVGVLRPAVPPALSATIGRALERHAVDRFPSARAFREALSNTTAPGPAALAPRRRHPHWSLIASVLAAVGVTAWWLLARRAGSDATAPLDPARIAVLYFEDFSSGGQLSHLADGFTEALIHELSQVNGLTVISPFGVRPFRDATVSIDSIVRALSVGTLVEGSVEREGDHLRATVQLVDGATGTPLLSRQVNRAGTDLLNLRDGIVAEVADLLRQRLGEEIRLRESRAEAANDAAWELMQRAGQTVAGANELLRAGDVQAGRRALERADSLLATAGDSAPRWSEPLAVRARLAAGWSGWLRANGAPREMVHTVLQEGMTFVWRGLESNPQDPALLAERGRLNTVRFLSAETEQIGDSVRDVAERDLRAALNADPGRAGVWNVLSELLQMSGRFAEARQAARRAFDADPFLLEAAEVLIRLCATSLEMDEVDAAREYCDEGRRRFPQDPQFLLMQLFVEGAADPDVEAAWSYTDSARAFMPSSSEWVVTTTELLMAGILAAAGLRDSAQHVLDRAMARAPMPGNLENGLYVEAWARAQLGQRDSSIAILRRYFDLFPSRRAYIREDLAFRSLRNDPRFQELVGR